MKRIQMGLLTLLVFLPFTTEAKVKLTKLKLETAKQIKIPKALSFDSSTFKRTDTHIYENPFMGGAITYQDKSLPELSITLYIYPIAHETMSLERQVSNEFTQLMTQIKDASDYRGLKAVLMADELMAIDQKNVLFSRHSLVSDQGDLISDTYLTNNQFHFIKIRMSYPPMRTNPIKQTSAKLASQLLQNIQVKEHKKTRIAQIINSIEDNEPLNTHFIGAQLLYLLALTNAIDKDQLIFSFEQQLKALETAAKISEQVNSNQEKLDDVLYLEAVDKAGFLAELAWSQLKQPHWQRPVQLDLDGFKAWIDKHQDKFFFLQADMGRITISYER